MSDRVEYLEWELERYKEAERQRIDERLERDEQRERERKERREAELNTADSWPEALRNQYIKMSREVEEDAKWGYESQDPFFKDGAAACARALELWREISPTKDTARAELKEQITALQEALDTIEEEVAQEVGLKLLEERSETDHKPMDGWRMIANNMIEGVDLHNFLYW